MSNKYNYSKYVFMHAGPTPPYDKVFEDMDLNAASWWKSVCGITDVFLIFFCEVSVQKLVDRLTQHPDIYIIPFATGEVFRAVSDYEDALACIPPLTEKARQFPKRKIVEIEGAEIVHRLQRDGKREQRDQLHRHTLSDSLLTHETLSQWREQLARADSFFTVEPPVEAVWEPMDETGKA
jgi:hypothetical protein